MKLTLNVTLAILLMCGPALAQDYQEINRKVCAALDLPVMQIPRILRIGQRDWVYPGKIVYVFALDSIAVLEGFEPSDRMIAHELAHSALYKATMGSAPAKIQEIVAGYAEYKLYGR